MELMVNTVTFLFIYLNAIYNRPLNIFHHWVSKHLGSAQQLSALYLDSLDSHRSEALLSSSSDQNVFHF